MRREIREGELEMGTPMEESEEWKSADKRGRGEEKFRKEPVLADTLTEEPLIQTFNPKCVSSRLSSSLAVHTRGAFLHETSDSL